MTNEEYLACQQQIIALAGLVCEMPLREFVACIDRAEAVGSILDPTLYRKGAAKMQRIRELAAALLKVQDVAKAETVLAPAQAGIDR